MPDFSQIWDLLFLISVGQDNRSVSPPYQGTGCFRIKPEYFPLPQERVSHIFFSIPLLYDNPAAYCNNTSRSPRPDCKNQNPVLSALLSGNPTHPLWSFSTQTPEEKQFLFLQMPDSASYSPVPTTW